MDLDILFMNPGLVLGVDPGPKFTAYALFDTVHRRVLEKKKALNTNVLADISRLALSADVCIFEQIKAYGSVGDSLFFTAMWTGRFISAWLNLTQDSRTYSLLPRKTVVSSVCGVSRANDSHLRQALIDYFTQHGGKQGGGKVPIIGLKKSPGCLYGVSADVWSALGVAVCWGEFTEQDRRTCHLAL